MSVVKDGLLGFAIGDAMGLPVKTIEREKLLDNPVTGMTGGGIYNMPLGTWSNDTSMVIATIDSIISTKEINYNDIADKFCNWIKDGDYTCNGEVFDADETTKKAIVTYATTMDATKSGETGFKDNGNASLVRILPIVFYCYFNNLREDEVFEIVKGVSSITHANDVCVLGCFIFVKYLLFILNGKDKLASYNMIKYSDYSTYFDEDIIEYYNRLLKTNINNLRVEDLKSDSYVVYTLETVLWIVLNCNSYAETIVGAINLGGDTDTIGALAGAVAGVLYGFNDIPDKWLSKINKLDYLVDMFSKFEEFLNVPIEE